MREIKITAKAAPNGRAILDEARVLYKMPEATVVPYVLGWMGCYYNSAGEMVQKEVNGERVRVAFVRYPQDQQGNVEIAFSLMSDRGKPEVPVDSEAVALLTDAAADVDNIVTKKVGEMSKLAETFKQVYEAGMLAFLENEGRKDTVGALRQMQEHLSAAFDDHLEDHRLDREHTLRSTEITDKQIDEIWRTLEAHGIKRMGEDHQ